MFESVRRVTSELVERGSCVRVSSARLSGSTTFIHELSSQLVADGRSVIPVVGDRALSGVPLGGIRNVISEHITGNIGVARAAELLGVVLDRARLPVLLIDELGRLDAPSIAVIDIVQRRTKVPIVYTLDEGAAAAGLVPTAFDWWPEARVVLPSLRFEEARSFLAGELRHPMEAEAIARIRTMAAGRVGLLARIAQSAVATHRLMLREGFWTMTGPSLWNDDLTGTVESLLSGLGADARRALELLSRTERSQSSDVVAPELIDRLSTRGFVRAIPGVDPRRHVAVVPPLIADYFAERDGEPGRSAAATREAPARGPIPLTQLIDELRAESDIDPAATARYFRNRCSVRENAAFARWERNPSTRHAAALLSIWWGAPIEVQRLGEVFAHTTPEGSPEDEFFIALCRSLWMYTSRAPLGEVTELLTRFAESKPDWSDEARAFAKLLTFVAGAAGDFQADPDDLSELARARGIATIIHALMDVYRFEPWCALGKLDTVRTGSLVSRLESFVRGLALVAAGEVEDALAIALAQRAQSRRNADPFEFICSSYVAAIAFLYQGEFDDANRVIDGVLTLGSPGFLVGSLFDAMLRLSAVEEASGAMAIPGRRGRADAPELGPLPGMGTATHDVLSGRHASSDFDAACADLIERDIDHGFVFEAVSAGLLMLCSSPGPKTLERLRSLLSAHGNTAHDQLLEIARALIEVDDVLLAERIAGYRPDGDCCQVGMILRSALNNRTSSERHHDVTALEAAISAFAQRFPRAGTHVVHLAERASAVGLSRRELEVARMVGNLGNLEIASKLGLSVRTVEHHVSRGLAKSGVASRKELSDWVRQHRIRRPTH